MRMKKIIQFTLMLFLAINTAFAQNQLKGSVKDSEGQPIAGTSLIINGTKIYAVSDEHGLFNFSETKSYPFTLRASFVGFVASETVVSGPQTTQLDIVLEQDDLLAEVLITSRRRQEEVQAVPIPISVVSGALIEDAQAFNVNRLKELVPTVQLYSSNPRNTTLNIRGLGSTFGLTNDGIDPGVGFYVDGVYYARPAVTTLDFIDIEQVEVLRGPQGTLFGKNTTSGAFNITTRRPRFQPDVSLESSFGNYGFVQTKGSVTGPLNRKLAARLSFSGTQRHGLLYNVATEKFVNTLNNLGVRGQFLYLPSDKVEILVAADATRQRPDG